MALTRTGLLLIISFSLLASPSGCGRKTQVESDSTTTGQALQDLADARDKGLITDQEYDKQRKRILKDN